MPYDISQALLIFFRTISQILTAGIAITAFSLFLFLLTLNLKDKVIRAFGIILVAFVIIYTSEAFGSTASSLEQLNFWLHFQWIGIILLPAAYFQFSDAILATTGKPSRGRRTWTLRIIYFISLVSLVLLASNRFVGSLADNTDPVVRITPTLFTHLFSAFYLLVMVLSWYNFTRAYKRTTTYTSRRRVAYILIGGFVPAIGSFPFLLFGSEFAAQHSLFFWMVVAFLNLILGVFIVITAYAVAFFGVSWPDRLVKSRLLVWILRGPIIASLALAITTIIRRFGEIWGTSYTALVPVSMVVTIVLGQYLITILAPLWDRWFIPSQMREELDIVKHLENSFLTKQDLSQFLEMVLASVCDQLQAPGAYLVSLDDNDLELVVTVGASNFDDLKGSDDIGNILLTNGVENGIFSWDENLLVPLIHLPEDGKKNLLGFLVVCGVGDRLLGSEQRDTLHMLSNRAEMALRDRDIQKRIFTSVEELTPQIDLIQKMRAAGSYDNNVLLLSDGPLGQSDLVQIVKEALTHYWGGPKLTNSPLVKLQVVQEALKTHNGNDANALRSILREAIDRVRPEGERHFTGEWILYNILEMKFMEGRKVREIALRLAMSEADLYRKQKVAIENVAKIIMEMEQQSRISVN